MKIFKQIALSSLLTVFGYASTSVAAERDNIAELQFRLHALGFDAGAVDGLWGGTTRKALQGLASELGVNFGGQLTDETIAFVSKAFGELPLGKYPNESAHYTTMNAQKYEVFPLNEIACRAVFQASWIGLKEVDEIREFLTDSECNDINYKSTGDSLAHAIQSGAKVDFDGDGIRDQLVFFYGFQPNTPLTVLAFKLDKDIDDALELPPSERVSPIARIFQPEEVFSSGEYPVVQSARFLSVADFNNDGIEDVFVSDDGYDSPPHQLHYPAKVFLSSPNGYDVEEITGPRKSHASAAGDINGDGYVDLVLGWGKRGRTRNPPFDSSRLFLNLRGEGFIEATAMLPKSLQKRNGRQPLFVELVDIDNDGYLDLFAGMGCGWKSKVFWNDGRGFYTDENATVAPLPYEAATSQCNRDVPTNAHAIHLVQEESTNKRYLGIWSSKNWTGRHLTLHRIEGRNLSDNVAKVPFEKIQAEGVGDWAYAIDYAENENGHVVSIYDIRYRRTLIRFNPITETYSYGVTNHAQNQRWIFDKESVLNSE